MNIEGDNLQLASLGELFLDLGELSEPILLPGFEIGACLVPDLDASQHKLKEEDASSMGGEMLGMKC